MRFPIKFNRSYWPETITINLPSAADPRVLYHEPLNDDFFSDAISTFKFGTTFKSTQKGRFPQTVSELSSLFNQTHPVILDVGASDGITSLDLIHAIQFSRYYVTDLNVEVSYQVSGDATWFYDEAGTCILKVNDQWVVYPDLKGAIFPFDRITKSLFKQAPKPASNSVRITLINPLVKAENNPNIIIKKHSIFDTWPDEKADLIVAGNILNPGYFTSSEIEQAFNQLCEALKEPGIIAIIDNRPDEKSTIFQIENGNVTVINKINGGTEIEDLALSAFSRTNR